jgi:RNA-directed DNA polymerase
VPTSSTGRSRTWELRRVLVRPGEAPVNTGALSEAELYRAERRVLEIQTKLHRWSGEDRARRFDDLFNLVADPAFLAVAWTRVRGNTGSRSAGVDGVTAMRVRSRDDGETGFLHEIR